MRRFDACNADADGLCSLVQWRLDRPLAAMLLAGLKREIELRWTVDASAGPKCSPAGARATGLGLAALCEVPVRWGALLHGLPQGAGQDIARAGS